MKIFKLWTLLLIVGCLEVAADELHPVEKARISDLLENFETNLHKNFEAAGLREDNFEAKIRPIFSPLYQDLMSKVDHGSLLRYKANKESEYYGLLNECAPKTGENLTLCLDELSKLRRNIELLELIRDYPDSALQPAEKDLVATSIRNFEAALLKKMEQAGWSPEVDSAEKRLEAILKEASGENLSTLMNNDLLARYIDYKEAEMKRIYDEILLAKSIEDADRLYEDVYYKLSLEMDLLNRIRGYLEKPAAQEHEKSDAALFDLVDSYTIVKLNSKLAQDPDLLTPEQFRAVQREMRLILERIDARRPIGLKSGFESKWRMKIGV